MTNDWKLSGYIKHFHLWKSAKSQGEIKKLMNEEIRVTGQEDDLVCGWEFDATVEDDTNIRFYFFFSPWGFFSLLFFFFLPFFF